ncbi:MAG TPA: hypothetical protein VKK79_11030, partial [Candidatus Lokiarchaeia archaeon]|nr:hypothetical protein [Candidatus Lokiarchaeia archaeon]
LYFKQNLCSEIKSRLAAKMTDLVDQWFEIIVNRVKNNMPLDPLDWTNPRFLNWADALLAVYDQYPTDTAADLRQRLNAEAHSNNAFS